MENVNYDDYSKFIFVEGSTDKKLVEKLIKNFSDKKDYLIIDYEGITKLENRLRDFHKNDLPSFKHAPIKKIYLTLDADDSCDDSFDKTIALLTKLNSEHSTNQFPVPSSKAQFEKINYGHKTLELGIFILPDNNSSGCLESAMLKAITHPDLLAITDSCKQDVNDYHIGRQQTKPYNPQFSQLEYLRYLFYIDGLRIAYKHDYNNATKAGFDFDSEELKPLKDFLR